MSDINNHLSDAGLVNSTHVPVLTIALPVFNGGDVVLLSIRSIVCQSFQDWELLIIDDGSTDGLPDKLNQFHDARIHIICDGKNKGLAIRLNEAIKMTRSKYFARMDHDDICHPERLALQIEYLTNNSSIDLIGSKCITIDENEKVIGVLPDAVTHDDICRRPWQGFYLPHPSWTGKTEWFKKYMYKIPAPYYCEDQELLLRANCSSQYHSLPLSLLAYRVRTVTPWKKLLLTRISLCKVQARYFVRKGSYSYAIMSIIAAVLRVAGDVVKNNNLVRKKQNILLNRNILTASELSFWEAYIERLKSNIDVELQAKSQY